MRPREVAGERRPVVVGVDGSQGSARALEWALREALDRRAPVCVVTAWSWDTTGSSPGSAGQAHQARQTQEALVRAVLAGFPGPLPDLVTDLVQADPASALIERSAGGDLLVLGSRGLSGAAGAVIGSVADACLRHAGCPVVVIPADPVRDLPGQVPAPSRRSGLAPAAVAAFGLL